MRRLNYDFLMGMNVVLWVLAAIVTKKFELIFVNFLLGVFINGYVYLLYKNARKRGDYTNFFGVAADDDQAAVGRVLDVLVRAMALTSLLGQLWGFSFYQMGVKTNYVYLPAILVCLALCLALSMMTHRRVQA